MHDLTKLHDYNCVIPSSAGPLVMSDGKLIKRGEIFVCNLISVWEPNIAAARIISIWLKRGAQYIFISSPTLSITMHGISLSLDLVLRGGDCFALSIIEEAGAHDYNFYAHGYLYKPERK